MSTSRFNNRPFVLSIISLMAVLVLVVPPASARPAGPPAQPHIIHLKAGAFTPSPGIDLPGIRSQAGSEIEDLHFLAQFHDVPSPGEITALETDGITLLAYVSGNTYIATGNLADIMSLSSHEAVLWAGPILSKDKISPDLEQGNIGSWARAGEGLVALTVYFHVDVAIEDAARQIEDLDGEIVGMAPDVPSVTAIFAPGKFNIISRQDDVQFIDVVDIPLGDHNDGARVASNVAPLWNAPYNLSGAGVTVLVYDSGTLDSGHPDFSSRVVEVDGDASETIRHHSTHVAGTVGGDGSNSNGNDSAGNPNGGTAGQWAGMAPGVNFRSFGTSGSTDTLYNSAGDINADFTTAITNGIDLATMSQGNNVVSNGFPCGQLGDYTNTAILLDNIVRGSINGQQLIYFESAGNERQASAPCGTYSTISSPSTSKNPISIGAINSNDDSMTTFSSWGPTDDGRLKPDLVAPGCQRFGDGGITSTGIGDATALGGDGDGNLDAGETQNLYVAQCGTSMATPTTAGAGALLIEQWRTTRGAGSRPLPHTMKAILTYTAVDLGNAGPDYQNGYGALDAQAAVDLIIADDSANLIIVDQVNDDEVLSWRFNSDGAGNVVVQLAWDDPAAAALVATTLINDLDLRLISPSGIVYMPWALNPAIPMNAATTGDDSINNVEQVVGAAEAGSWMVAVIGDNVPTGPQQFTLITPEDGRKIDEEDPDLAYNNTTDEFLMVWASNGNVKARIPALDGSRLGPARTLFQAFIGENERTTYSEPAVTAKTVVGDESIYFVVAKQTDFNELTRATISKIVALRVSVRGEIAGSPINLSGSSSGVSLDGRPDVATDGTGFDCCMLAVWRFFDPATATSQIKGRRINFNGILAGPEFVIAEGFQPAVTGGDQFHDFLVAYTKGRSAGELEIARRMVGRTSGVGSELVISESSPLFFDAVEADVVFNRRAQRYLAVWRTLNQLGVSDEIQISGQLLDALGDKVGDNLVINPAPCTVDDEGRVCGETGDPAVASATDSHGFLVVFWESGVVSFDRQIRVRHVDSAGEMQTEFTLFQRPGFEDRNPAIAYSGEQMEFLVAWESQLYNFVEVISVPTPGLKTLRVTLSGSGNGVVVSDVPGINCGTDCTHSYAAGTVVRLTPSASPGAVFEGWSGAADCADGTVTLNSSTACEAIFSVNTSAGSFVNVPLIDAATGVQSSITFSRVDQSGITSFISSSSAPEPPEGFMPGTPPAMYDLSTTASFSGPVEVCVDYIENAYRSESRIRLFHAIASRWTDVTSSLNTADDEICGTVETFSFFGIFEPADHVDTDGDGMSDGEELDNGTDPDVPGPGLEIERVSVASDGSQATGGLSGAGKFSANGRFVLMNSLATNLVPGDTNGAVDVFVHDRQTGETARVSIASGGVEGNGESRHGSISADGRVVAFDSDSFNLVSEDGNEVTDVFVHDRQTGETVRVSVGPGGVESDSDSFFPSISADGRFVAFHSNASNLVVGATNGRTHIVVHDRQTGETVRVSVASDGTPGDRASTAPRNSADGRFVAFQSRASNLVGEAEFDQDVFVHDRDADNDGIFDEPGAISTTRVSVASDGTEASGRVGAVHNNDLPHYLSADGRFVTFLSTASNLVAGDTNGFQDVFVHDRDADENGIFDEPGAISTTRVSVALDGTEANGASEFASMSADGRFVAFASQASNLVPGDTNSIKDIFVHDRVSGRTARVSRRFDGNEAKQGGAGPHLSPDGRFISFRTICGCVEGDTNALIDAFVVRNPLYPDRDADGISDGNDNCPTTVNPQQSDVDGDGAGDLCDACPADASNSCDPQGSDAAEIIAEDGGSVETPDDALAIDIDAGDLSTDTTISVTETSLDDPEVDLTVGSSPGVGEAVAVYDLEPDGLVFDEPITLTMVADVTKLNAFQRDQLDIYILTSDDTVSDTFVAVGATCNVVESPPGIFIATCVAEIDHFSVYAVVAPLDGDNDGIPDQFGEFIDVCPEDPNIVEGFLPPLAGLVAAGEADSPLPDQEFEQRKTLPLKLRLFCGAQLLSSNDLDPPEIVALVKTGEEIDLDTVDLDSGAANDQGLLFRRSGDAWIYNLSTTSLGTGTYVITISLPDGRRFKGSFVLR